MSSSISNDVAGVGTGSLFSTGASVSNSSAASKVSDINIGSVAGAQSAINVLDEALRSVNRLLEIPAVADVVNRLLDIPQVAANAAARDNYAFLWAWEAQNGHNDVVNRLQAIPEAVADAAVDDNAALHVAARNGLPM